MPQLFDTDFNLPKAKIKPILKEKGTTFAPPVEPDGAIEIETNDAHIPYNPYAGYGFDLDAVSNDDYELILTYRQLAIQQEIAEAVEEVVNEAIVTENINDKYPVELKLDNIEDLSDNIKEKIRDEFKHVMKLMKFKTEGYGIFRKWYVDGRLYYHKVLDESSAKKGIVKLVPIDPINIKYIREVKKKKEGKIDIYKLEDVNEYFLYSDRPFIELKKQGGSQTHSNTSGLKIPKEAISYVPSGLLSSDGKIVLSHLYRAIKPANNLKMMEDSLVIYRWTRAPERRIFYVDVGNLPKGKADQYLKDTMNRFRNKIVYDVNKGTINSRKKYQTMMEDYWLPRREGGRGTEVTTLPGGQNLSELEDVEYIKNKLYRSLNVPLSRFQSDGQAFNFGKTTEITRDEITFSKFIARLRRKFSELFSDILRTQLLLKKVVTVDEWDDIRDEIIYDFIEDNYFQELKELEVLNDRIEALTNLNNSEIVGKYMSHDTVRKKIMRQSEEEISIEDEIMDIEKEEPRYKVADEFDDDGEPGKFGRPIPEGDDVEEVPINKEAGEPEPEEVETSEDPAKKVQPKLRTGTVGDNQ